MLYDVAIIGSGPAGVSAALNLKALGKNFIWFGSVTVSEKVARAELIRNYPALPDVTGEQLGAAFKRHCDIMGIGPLEEVVSGVYENDGIFSLLAANKSYDARSVILCLGVQTSAPLQGEEEFVGRGISYCATCDGFLYKGKKIAVLCTDKRFEHEVEFLCGLAEKAYVMPFYKGYEIKSRNAEIILKRPVNLTGGMRLEKVVFKDGELSVDGMFILKGAISPSTLVHGLKTENGHIAVNRDCSTNIAGIFAAGDCTGRPYQYIKAAGEGNVAAHSAVGYLK